MKPNVGALEAVVMDTRIASIYTIDCGTLQSIHFQTMGITQPSCVVVGWKVIVSLKEGRIQLSSLLPIAYLSCWFLSCDGL